MRQTRQQRKEWLIHNNWLYKKHVDVLAIYRYMQEKNLYSKKNNTRDVLRSLEILIEEIKAEK